ncbi:hypothetical protein CY0110_18867 [Crocosphaera chwakensis CCY0110]|uniref:Uncharacterized protein n=1 Tax=Crocosphaera chwakensis CCY0110 TaxID=391612 RepID=A3IJA5_9CHRO|nr:hypothetical protein CY0110_18867 [Crocosphaera chwakensis CCY0110]
MENVSRRGSKRVMCLCLSRSNPLLSAIARGGSDLKLSLAFRI